MKRDYVTIGVAAEALGIAMSTVKARVDQGKVPGVQELETKGLSVIMIPREWVAGELDSKIAELIAAAESLEENADET